MNRVLLTILPAVLATPAFAAGGPFLSLRNTNFVVLVAFLIFIGVLLYFAGSMQGTFEALRSLNEMWHFTDFTVGHAHFTMYGFVAFVIWGGVYALVPRLSGREPSHGAIGLHFWLSIVGLAVYVGALSIGGTLRGLSWMSGAPFIESVTLMAPFWLGRAVGGTLMLASHFVFAWNLWQMRPAAAREVQLAAPRRAAEASVA